MKIRRTNKEDAITLAQYQSKVFPKRGLKFSLSYMDFWFSKGSDAENSFVLVDEEGNICGQDLFSTMNYWFDNTLSSAVWGFDIIVNENLRKDTWGIDLLLAPKGIHNIVFATGSNPNALKINLKLGQNLIGELRKYVKIVSPFYFVHGFFKGQVLKSSYPQFISINNKVYESVRENGYPELHAPFNAQLLEFGRDIDFLKWRYGQLHDYVFYREQGSDNYFVVRTIIKKHITALVIVDFRCSLKDDGEYGTIVQAATLIAKKLHLPILITGSSLAVTDAVLENHGFRSVGRPRPIIGNDKRLKHHEEEVKNRNFCIVTLADSDGEVGW